MIKYLNYFKPGDCNGCNLAQYLMYLVISFSHYSRTYDTTDNIFELQFSRHIYVIFILIFNFNFEIKTMVFSLFDKQMRLHNLCVIFFDEMLLSALTQAYLVKLY